MNRNNLINFGNDNSRGAEHPRHRKELEPLISLYQDRETSPAEGIKVEEYLRTCQGCRRVLEDYRLLADGMNRYMAGISQPAPFKSLAQLKAQDRVDTLPEVEKTGTGRKKARGGFSGRLQPSFAMAFSLVAVLLVSAAFIGLVLLNLPRESGGTQASISAGQVESVTPEKPTPTVVPSPTPEPIPTATPSPEPPPSGPPPTVSQVAQTTAAIAATSQPVPVNTPETRASGTTVAVTTQAPVKSTTPPATTATTTTTASVAVASPATNTVAITTTTADTSAATGPSTVTATTASAAVTVTTTPQPPVTTPSTTPVTVRAAGWISYINKEDGEIYIIKSDGSNRVQLSAKSAAKQISWRQLVWSTDTSWVAAVGLNTETGKYGIYQYRVTAQPVTQPDLNFIAEGVAPVWSPTSYWMSFLAAPVKQANGVLTGQPAVIDLKKRKITILSKDYSGITPQWFDDEQRLLVNQDKIMDRNGNEVASLNLFENTCANAGLSFKGNKLVVLEQASGVFHPVLYDLNNNEASKIKRSALTFSGNLGHGNDCGAYTIKWTADSSGFSFYFTQGNGPSTCWVNAAADYFKCLKNVQFASFSYDASYYVDLEPGSSNFYAAIYGDKPSGPRFIGESKYAPVWQPLR